MEIVPAKDNPAPAGGIRRPAAQQSLPREIYRRFVRVVPFGALGWYTLHMLKRIPLVFTPQPEGGFTVTSPVLPELLTEGDTLEAAYSNVRDALAAVVELYADQGRILPQTTTLPDGQIVWSDALVDVA